MPDNSDKRTEQARWADELNAEQAEERAEKKQAEGEGGNEEGFDERADSGPTGKTIQGASEENERSPGGEDDYESSLNQTRQRAKQIAKEKAKQATKQAVKVVAKSFWRAVIVPVISAIGAFIAATWYIWLILLVLIIIIVLGYAYAQEIYDKIPSWAQPAFKAILDSFIPLDLD